MNDAPIPKPILVIEDNEDDLFLLRRGFRRANLDPELEVATDGQEALDYLSKCLKMDGSKARLPAFILLDLQLPHLTGLQVLEWIRDQELLCRIPVIILTSSSNEADVDRAYDAGANAYLVKPSTLDEQTKMIQACYLFWFEFNQLPATNRQEA